MAERHLARLAEQAVDRHGDYDSLWFEGRWHRSGELHERSRRLASGLRELGVEPGDRVVVLMTNRPEVPVVYNAIWRAGAAVTPAIFLLPPAELRRLVADADARAIVTSPELAETALAAAEGLDGVRAVVAAGPEFEALEQGDPAPITARDESDLAALMYTGGTTGRAKGVMLSHENLWQAGKAGHDAGYVPGITRSLTSLPLSHAYGLLVTVVGMHAREPGVDVLLRWFEPATWLRLAEEHAVQVAAVVPSMLQLLLGQPLEEHDLSELRYVVSGAAPLAPDVLRAFRERVPGVEVREGYGLTETSALVTTNRPGDTRDGTVGRPVRGVELRIVDDGDADVPTGEVGEICCRSPFVMLGYWRDPEQTAEAMRGGWLHTGDLGRVVGDGSLTIVDRKKDLIIRGGFNVFPRDVEDALLEHPAVAAAGVVGRPDEVHGEEVVAFVSLSPGTEAAADELVAFGKRRLGGYRYPREVHVLDALPLTPVGKVDRKALRALTAAVGAA